METSLRKALLSLACFTLLLAAGATTARADTIVITSGHYTAHRNVILNPFFDGSLRGNDFSLSYGGRDFTSPGIIFCDPCLPGQVRGTTIRPTTFTSLGVTINGASFSQIASVIGPVPGNTPMQLTLVYAGPDIVIPDTMNPVVTVPFTLTGHLTVFSATSNTPLYDFDLVGTGFLTIRFSTYFLPESFGDRPLQNFESMTLNFGPEPVPEPATLVLLGTGLAGVVVKVRRRRKQRDA